MRPRRFPCAGAAALLVIAAPLAAPLAAQDPAPPDSGARVRLVLQGGESVTGRMLAVRRDTLWLRVPAVPPSRAIPATDVRTYAVSLGRERWLGRQYGGMIGGAIGALVLGLAIRADLRTDAALTIPTTAVAAPVAVGITLAGVAIGHNAAPDRWGPAMPWRVGR